MEYLRRDDGSRDRLIGFAFSQMSRAEQKNRVSARGKLSRKLFLFFALNGLREFHIGLTTACETEKHWRTQA
jgi:hypothetical protein